MTLASSRVRVRALPQGWVDIRTECRTPLGFSEELRGAALVRGVLSGASHVAATIHGNESVLIR